MPGTAMIGDAAHARHETSEKIPTAQPDLPHAKTAAPGPVIPPHRRQVGSRQHPMNCGSPHNAEPEFLNR